MAFPFKTGGDFYNCEAQRMRLHNLGANPTETATGLMYFNTGASNLGKHAVVHDGTKFKALAFVDEIATNTAFTELAERVLTIEKALGEDTANVIDTWEEIQNFLKNINENDADLMTLLNGKLDKAGGTIEGTNMRPLTINTTTSAFEILMQSKGNTKVCIGWGASDGAFFQECESSKYLGIKRDGTPYYYNDGHLPLIHSGNIGEYAALYKGNVGGANSGGGSWLGYTFTTAEHGGRYAGGIISAGVADYGFQLNGDLNGKNLAYRSREDGKFTDWKTIAFTDSDITGYSAGLKHSNGTIGAVVNSSGNVTIGDQDLAGTNAKLNVHNILSVSTESATPSAKLSIQQFSSPNAVNGIHLFVGSNNSSYANARPLVLQNGYGNVLIGTPTEIKSGAKLQIKGDVYVEGNIIATKESSAGGAGQEGESGDGGAEVLAQPLAKGQSTYTITNTIGRSDIAVSLYEANVINGQTIWSLCLADIEVTDSTITVTFGSATSVNHKLVAVG